MLKINTIEGKLRVIGFLEAFSWLLLLGVAMPLKYIWHLPLMVRIVGSAHGTFFLAYIAILYVVSKKHSWEFKTMARGFIYTFLPFGTLFFDKTLRFPDEAKLKIH